MTFVVALAARRRATTTVSSRPGARDPRINADGLFVTYQENASSAGGTIVFVYSREANSTTTVSDSSGNPSINVNGKVIAFTSAASGLVAYDTDNTRDVFVPVTT